MAEASVYTFDLMETATLLLKAQGIHEGVWVIGFEFAFQGALFGPSEKEAKPTAVAQINKVVLNRHPGGGISVPGIAVDAAKTNPRSE